MTLDGVSRTKHSFGKGQVVWGLPPAEVLAGAAHCRRMSSTAGRWMRRCRGFIVAMAMRTSTLSPIERDHPHEIDVRFRVSGKEAELWHADTGAIEPANYSSADGRTTVPLNLAERESVFVVFRRPAACLRVRCRAPP